MYQQQNPQQQQVIPVLVQPAPPPPRETCLFTTSKVLLCLSGFFGILGFLGTLGGGDLGQVVQGVVSLGIIGLGIFGFFKEDAEKAKLFCYIDLAYIVLQFLYGFLTAGSLSQDVSDQTYQQYEEQAKQNGEVPISQDEYDGYITKSIQGVYIVGLVISCLIWCIFWFGYKKMLKWQAEEKNYAQQSLNFQQQLQHAQAQLQQPGQPIPQAQAINQPQQQFIPEGQPIQSGQYQQLTNEQN